MPAYKHGDLCSIPLGPRRNVSARVLLDVGAQCLRTRQIPVGSPLAAYDGAVLLEVYREVVPEPSFHQGEVLIPGVFVDPTALKTGRWPIGGYAPVKPDRIDFPETLIDSYGQARFHKGEIDLPLPLDGKDVDHYQVYPTIVPAAALPDICLHYLEADAQITHDYAKAMHLKNSDLRFSDNRKGVYQLLGLDPDAPYPSVAETFGFDIRRFYR